ncbi:MAG TPA: alpha/beta hydrolase [Candidatus Binatia bacterium]|nr:alpha/beta hydrolase [Candidatus Binatia bacterium]
MTLERLTIHGHTVTYRTAGTGPVILLVHGMAGSSETWTPVATELARRFTVVAPDLLGHGGSAKPRGEYSVAAHANVLRDLLAALGHERATLVGQSLGGGIAMQLAYQYPERCDRLVLVSSGGLGREVSLLLRALSIPGAEYVLAVGCSRRVRDAVEHVAGWLGRAGLRVGPALVEIWRGHGGLAEPTARAAFFRTLRAVVDPRGQTVSAVDRLYLAAHVPTLIVWGARDGLIPVSHAQAAHAAIPGSRLVVFEDAGHFPHCEAPERFAATLTEFVDATEPARVSADLLRERLLGGAVPAAGLASDAA